MELIPHSFNRFSLTEDEARAGRALTISNQAVIQNLVATIAEEKLHLVLDTQNISAYAQNEAYLRGQLDILNHLLDLSRSDTAIVS